MQGREGELGATLLGATMGLHVGPGQEAGAAAGRAFAHQCYNTEPVLDTCGKLQHVGAHPEGLRGWRAPSNAHARGKLQ